MGVPDKVTIEGARIIFRNFAGKEDSMNAAGNRNFCVLLDEATADAMRADGWNVKTLKPRDDGEEPQAYLPVAVSYKVRKPRVVMVTSRGRTSLDEDQVEVLDWVDIANVDLIINPYAWAVRDNSGIKAYLQSIYIIIEEDALERKYADVPELGGSGERLAIEAGPDDGARAPYDIEGEVVE